MWYIDGDWPEWRSISIKEASKMSINRSISSNIEKTYSANKLVSFVQIKVWVYAGLRGSVTSKGTKFPKAEYSDYS
jgi:hypothetical protein